MTGVAVARPASKVSLAVQAKKASVISMGGVVINSLVQLAYPPLLLSHWGDAGFGFVVAVQGFASYVSVADAGVQVYFIQRIASLRAARNHAAADARTASCFRLLGGLALVGFVVVFAAFVGTGHAVWSGLVHRDGGSDLSGLAAAFTQIGSCAIALVLGGWCTAVDSGHGRYPRAQGFELRQRIFSPTVGMILLAVFRLRAAPALIVISALSIALDLVRYLLTRLEEPGPVRPEPVHVRPLLRLLYEARGSALWYVATSTQNGLQPYVAAVLSTAAVSVAVPGRTLANGCRSISQALGTAVWVAIAARFAELPDGKSRYAFWVRNAPALSIIQLACLAGLMAVAPIFVPHWIPSKGDAVLKALPWCCAEQAVYVAIIPSQYLLFATGSFGRIGVATLITAVVSVAATWLAVPHYGSVGFVAANTVSTLFILAPALAAYEWAHWRSLGVRLPAAVGVRFAVAVAAVGLCWLYARFPWAASGGMAFLTGLVALDYHRLRRRGPARPNSTLLNLKGD